MPNKKLVFQWIRTLQDDPTNIKAQELIIEHYSGLVKSLAYKYSANQFIYEDLVQVGMIGLFNAINRFDESFGISFEAFAIPTLLGVIKYIKRDHTCSDIVFSSITELVSRD